MRYIGKLHLKGECLCKLRRIEIALTDYYVEHGIHPYIHPNEHNEKLEHSWRVKILKYVGEKELYDQYNFDEPWNGPNNKKLHSKMPDIFRCSLLDKDSNCTSFMIVTDEKGNPYQEAEFSPPFIIETSNMTFNWLEPVDFPVNNFILETDRNSDRAPLRRSFNHYKKRYFSRIYCTVTNPLCISEDTKPDALKALADPEKRNQVKIISPWGENFGIQRAVLDEPTKP